MRAQGEEAEFYISGGSLPPGRGAAGSLLKYKTLPLPSAPSFSAHEIQRGEGEGEGGNSTGEAVTAPPKLNRLKCANYHLNG